MAVEAPTYLPPTYMGPVRGFKCPLVIEKDMKLKLEQAYKGLECLPCADMTPAACSTAAASFCFMKLCSSGAKRPKS